MNEPQIETTSSEDKPKPHAGYSVVLLDNGNFAFNIIGEATGIVELRGLHEHASDRIREITDQHFGTGVPGLMDQLLKLQGLVVSQNEQLENLVRRVNRLENQAEDSDGTSS